MPELPDVQVNAEYLDATSLHRGIDDADVLEPTLVKNTSARELEARLRGRSFEGTRRHGKWLFVELDDGGRLVVHFGMTGELKYYRHEADEPEHAGLVVTFENGYRLGYAAPRKLGELRLVEDVDAFIRAKELGPDPLDEDFDLDAFRGLLEGRRGTVKGALMDQSLLAGIGNEYSDEILFQMGLHPRIRVKALSDDRVEDLYRTMLGVLRTAIRARVDPERFPASYMLPHRHDDGRCPRCGGELAREDVIGRTAYYCPRCQGESP